jgi:diguanylate cyclase (GGDEF)-like protein
MIQEKSTAQILVVDDDPINLDMVATHLASAGYQPLTADNGIKALAILQDQNPSIAIVDWMMPKMDGLAVCREIRSHQSNGFIYFIMLTALSDKSRLMEAFDSGVDDFLSKPFHQGELLARVRAGVRMVGLYDELKAQTLAFGRNNVELAKLNEKLHQMAIVDELTGLYNRRHAMVRINEQWAMANRYGESVACAMLDIDHFKRVNDAHGHLKGDEVLQKVSKILMQSVRASDIVCRFGGEEFLILFPKQKADQAHTCAERCRAAIESSVFADDARCSPVTISIGIAHREPLMHCPDDLLKAADMALYAAKEQGRNRVVMAAQEAAPMK